MNERKKKQAGGRVKKVKSLGLWIAPDLERKIKGEGGRRGLSEPPYSYYLYLADLALKTSPQVPQNAAASKHHSHRDPALEPHREHPKPPIAPSVPPKPPKLTLPKPPKAAPQPKPAKRPLRAPLPRPAPKKLTLPKPPKRRNRSR